MIKNNLIEIISKKKVFTYQEKNKALEKTLYSYIKYVIISFRNKKIWYDISDIARK